MAMTARERLAEYATLKALGLRARLRRGADLRRVAGDRAAGGLLGDCAHVPGGGVRSAARCGTIFPVFEVTGRRWRCSWRARRRGRAWSAAVAARPARGARAHRRGPEGHRLIRDESDSHRLQPAQPLDAQAHDRAHRGRHGAGRVRVRGGADAGCRLAQDAGVDRAARQRRRDPPLGGQRGAERRRARPGGARRDPARGRRRCRGERCLQGDGGADRPAQARRRQAVRNVIVRGVSPTGLALRPQVRISRGPHVPPGQHARSSSAGASPSASRARRSASGCASAGATGPVVGVFDAGGSGFDSEIWGDVDQMMQAFRRQAYSSVIARLADPAASTRSSARSRPTRGSPST